ncbi:biopolymer transporter ExbD [Mucilaginibacter sp. Bleaf8]|uniref:ExbD/TolR family protein n=1 Tax=Mucilaginibacter sp. Bleaf8 TaxID=2834430 RepID=UPI001BCEECF9|nr:biopolymer transporter ExbD [Mucilaginibacter sp. Bleaf8]MBS7564570.1 biopolymer transporter ExbD [Mucilaginibacter sp. Bleaf8]
MAELNASAEKGNGSKRKTQNLRVDLTAMVDLAFLLVTFFMLTTTLSKPKAMDVAMPDKEPEPGQVSDKRTITVCLGNNDKALLYSGLIENAAPQVVDYGKAGLREALLQKQQEIFKATGKDMIVLVKPSEHSKYGNLVDALDELHITKVNRFAIVDITPDDIGLMQKQSVY